MASLSAEEPKGVMSANAVANFKTVTSANIDNRKGSLKFSGTEGLTADMIQKSISAIVNCEVTIDEEQLIATFPSKMYAEVVYKLRNNTPYTIEWVAEPVKNAAGSSQSPAQEVMGSASCVWRFAPFRKAVESVLVIDKRESEEPSGFCLQGKIYFPELSTSLSPFTTRCLKIESKSDSKLHRDHVQISTCPAMDEF